MRAQCEILNLSQMQAAIFQNLIKSAPETQSKTSARAIAAATGIGYPTVRHALNSLIKKGFVANVEVVRSPVFQGFIYVLNDRLVERFLTAVGLELRDDGGPIAGEATGEIADGLLVHSSSISSRFLKPLTTLGTSKPSASQLFVLSGAVEMFWAEEGLLEGQAQAWCRDFEVDPEQMKRQLEWAQFDLVNNGKESQVKKDAVSWFFGVLRRTGGCFPRPVNYKTPAELRADAVERDLAADKEALKRIQEAELEQCFQQILSNPEGEEYKRLYAKINNCMQEAKTGKFVVKALREEFFTEQQAR